MNFTTVKLLGDKEEVLLESFLRQFAIFHSDSDKSEEYPATYGVNYEDNKFMMHRFCWCEREDCQWCEEGAPNFTYKPLDISVWWYKHIGRGMEVNKKITCEDIKQMMKEFLRGE